MTDATDPAPARAEGQAMIRDRSGVDVVSVGALLARLMCVDQWEDFHQVRRALQDLVGERKPDKPGPQLRAWAQVVSLALAEPLPATAGRVERADRANLLQERRTLASPSCDCIIRWDTLRITRDGDTFTLQGSFVDYEEWSTADRISGRDDSQCVNYLLERAEERGYDRDAVTRGDVP